MDRAEAQQFRERWRAVEAIQTVERGTASLELRWRQLNAVYGLFKELGMTPDHEDEMQVYERWARLRERILLIHKETSDEKTTLFAAYHQG